MAAEKKKKALVHFRRPETDSGCISSPVRRNPLRPRPKPQTFVSPSMPSPTYSPTPAAAGSYAGRPHLALLLRRRISGRDMRLGLVDASAGKIGTPIDHVLL